MRTLSYRQAIAIALGEEMERDDKVILFGEDVAAAGGVFKATSGLLDRFGPDRVRDTPISEQAIIGAAIGAAVTGLRPVAELMFADFLGVAFDQVANQLAKYRYMTGGQVTAPVTLRLTSGAGLGFAAQHSQCAENWLLNNPGLFIAVPGTPRDLIGLMKSAIRSDDPVLVFEHKALFNQKQDVANEEILIPLGEGTVVKEGSDVTIVAVQQARLAAEQAASDLEREGIHAEVIDPRTLVPFDFELIERSLEKTGRFVAVCEGPMSGSWAANLTARVAVESFSKLRSAPRIVASPNTPVPFAAGLEAEWVPASDRVVEAVKEILVPVGPDVGSP